MIFWACSGWTESAHVWRHIFNLTLHIIHNILCIFQFNKWWRCICWVFWKILLERILVYFNEFWFTWKNSSLLARILAYMEEFGFTWKNSSSSSSYEASEGASSENCTRTEIWFLFRALCSIYDTVFTLSIWTPQVLTILVLKFEQVQFTSRCVQKMLDECQTV